MASRKISLWRSIKKRIFIDISVYLIYALIWLIFLTCKKKYSPTKLPNYGCVVVFWHGRLGMMSFAYRKWWGQNFHGKKTGKVIISDHKDGEIITRIIKFFNIGTIRGSSSKGGAKALIESLRDIKNGIDIIITPDGPRGPRHSVADGAVIVPQKTDSEKYVQQYEPSSLWEAN
ncbi:MAG: DUF374 domain-containing protein, partial [Campylobacter sp.]|nr:DUF374 domain-containing protein [Campylobacter sp.]